MEQKPNRFSAYVSQSSVRLRDMIGAIVLLVLVGIILSQQRWINDHGAVISRHGTEIDSMKIELSGYVSTSVDVLQQQGSLNDIQTDIDDLEGRVSVLEGYMGREGSDE